MLAEDRVYMDDEPEESVMLALSSPGSSTGTILSML